MRTVNGEASAAPRKRWGQYAKVCLGILTKPNTPPRPSSQLLNSQRASSTSSFLQSASTTTKIASAASSPRSSCPIATTTKLHPRPAHPISFGSAQASSSPACTATRTSTCSSSTPTATANACSADSSSAQPSSSPKLSRS
jgi:hypothetical protein